MERQKLISKFNLMIKTKKLIENLKSENPSENQGCYLMLLKMIDFEINQLFYQLENENF